MSGANVSTDSGGSHSLGMSHVQRREINARGNNPGSKTRKTGKRQTRKQGEQREEMPLLNVDGPRDREASRAFSAFRAPDVTEVL